MSGISSSAASWPPGTAPVAVIMISLNEAHNMEEVCENLRGWASEVILVDSFSKDDTVSIALRYGVRVVQRRFRGFGDQWNFALGIPVKSPWTMKMDPDERLSPLLKRDLLVRMSQSGHDAIEVTRRLWFMGHPLPAKLSEIRIWRTGRCRFSEVLVNEHPIVTGKVVSSRGEMEHHDSPDLEHWFHKQNRYSSDEAISVFTRQQLAAPPKLFGSALERRMWLKKNFRLVPFRFLLYRAYLYLAKGAWRGGHAVRIWVHLRVEVLRAREFKEYEMRVRNRVTVRRIYGVGEPDPRVEQH